MSLLMAAFKNKAHFVLFLLCICALIAPVHLQSDIVVGCEKKWTKGALETINCTILGTSYPSKCKTQTDITQFRRHDGVSFVNKCTVPDLTCTTPPPESPGCACIANSSDYVLQYKFQADESYNGTWDCFIGCYDGLALALTIGNATCGISIDDDHSNNHSNNGDDDRKIRIGAGVGGTCAAVACSCAAGYAVYVVYYKGNCYAKCCKCGKWRRLRMRKLKREKAKLRLIFLLGGWECDMNPDTNYNACAKEMDPNIDPEKLQKELTEKEKNSGERFEDLYVWVPCASCNKWRRLSSAEFAGCQDKVSSDRWTCNDHPDRTKRTCTTKQESGMEKDCQLHLWAKAFKVKVPSPQQRKSGFCPCFRSSANGGSVKPRDGRAQ